MKVKRTVAERQADGKLGTVFKPRVVSVGYRVRFPYDDEDCFEVWLETDGGLRVRVVSHYSDRLATHVGGANDITIVARRWSSKAMRYVEFVGEEGK